MNQNSDHQTLVALQDSIYDMEHSEDSTLGVMDNQRKSMDICNVILLDSLIKEHPESRSVLLQLDRGYSDAEDVREDAIVHHCVEYFTNN